MESQTNNILKDLARMTSSTTGTGTTIALTAADTNCLTFAQAGVPDGEIITYGIDDTGGREVGKAKYNSSGPSLTVQTVYSSTNGGSRINLTGNQMVSVVMSGKDMDSKQDNIEKQVGLIISHGSILLSKGGAVTAGTAPGSVLHASLALAEETGGASLEANLALLHSNVTLAAQIAVAFAA